MAQITLEERLLEAEELDVRETFGHLLRSLAFDFRKRDEPDGALGIAELTGRVITIYSCIYNAMRSKFEKERKNTSKPEDEFFRSYFMYVAAEGTIDLLKKDAATLDHHFSGRLPP